MLRSRVLITQPWPSQHTSIVKVGSLLALSPTRSTWCPQDKDLFGKNDPYAVLKCGALHYRTKTVKGGGKSPVWNETFTFHIITENTLEVK